jgi:hypothetical protein
LWIAVTAIAISIGGNLFQMVVIDPIWSAKSDSARSLSPGTQILNRVGKFHNNPFGLIGLLCLLASPLLAWNIPLLRKWLLLAVAIQMIIVLGTVLYFWPINKVLLEHATGLNPGTVTTLKHRWLVADRIRLALRFASFFCLLRALTLSAFAG